MFRRALSRIWDWTLSATRWLSCKILAKDQVERDETKPTTPAEEEPLKPVLRTQRLRARGRPIDPIFLEGEALYLRFEQDHLVDGKITTAAVIIRDQSVDRDRYAQSDDVLFDLTFSETTPRYHLEGVATFPVSDVTFAETPEPGKIYRLKVEHVPEELHYPHAEIRLYRNEEFLLRNPPKNAITKRWRVLLAEAASKNILHRPGEFTPEAHM